MEILPAESLSQPQIDARRPSNDHPHRGQGILLAVLAYGLWGVFPFYFKQLEHINSVEILAHRILWSLLLTAIILTFLKGWSRLMPAFRSLKLFALTATASILIATNWGFFLLAVSSNQLLQSSLGYFLGPMVSVMLGIVFLGERPRILQIIAFALAITGIGIFMTLVGQFPFIAIILAFSFALYGLVKKLGPIEPLAAMTLEMAILSPAALWAIFYFGDTISEPAVTLGFWAFLSLNGPVTVAPLLLFAGAARRLPLSSVGMLQYIVPTGHFLIAVIAFHEEFKAQQLISFIVIWIAVAVYITDLIRAANRKSK